MSLVRHFTEMSDELQPTHVGRDTLRGRKR